MNAHLLLRVVLMISSVLFAQPARAQLAAPPWVEAFGGPGTDIILDAVPAPLGGTWVTGSTSSFGQGGTDAWIGRVSASGIASLEMALGGTGGDDLTAIARTADGGCILAGSTSSFGAGGSDGWVVKLAASGTVQWQRTYGTAGEESFASIVVAKTDFGTGYYVGGTSEFGATQKDVWVLALAADGSVLWDWTYAGEKDDRLASLAATDDGLVFVANSNSSFGSGYQVDDIPFFRPWIVKLRANGQPELQRTFNYSGGDALSDIQVLQDGFVLTGEISAMSFFRGDVWVMRLDEMLNIVWDRRYGDHFGVTFVDCGRRVRALRDGGFLVAGSTSTAGAGSQDVYLLRLDSAGNRIADRTIGDVGFDGGSALVVQGNTVIVGGFLQQVTPQPVDALLTRARVPSPLYVDALCLDPYPTAPNSWTSALVIRTPNVPATGTTASSGVSSAVITNLQTGTFLCN